MFEDAALHAMDAQSSHVEEILHFRSIMQLSCSIHIITEVISKINSMIQLICNRSSSSELVVSLLMDLQMYLSIQWTKFYHLNEDCVRILPPPPPKPKK